MTRTSIDLNSEIGESFGLWKHNDDESVLPHLTSASIACGYHAGDHNSMLRMVEAASAAGVEMGAHFGYQDLFGFGYRRMSLPMRELKALVLYQLGALDAMLRTVGSRMHHVKAHGALYLETLENPDVARAVVEATATFDDSLWIYTTADSPCEEEARRIGLPTVVEFFPDRPLRADGTLLVDWADHFDPTPENVAARVRQFLSDGEIPAVGGGTVQIRADCMCVHSDSAAVAAAMREAVVAAGLQPAAPERAAT